MAGHVSQIPEPGDYRLFDLAGESIILVRDAGGAVRAHYNVCRHRGSRVLLTPAGNGADSPAGITAGRMRATARLQVGAAHAG